MDRSDDFTVKLAEQLSARSSRRGFLRLVGTAVVGAGLAMNGVSLAHASCTPVSCPNDFGACSSPVPVCTDANGFNICPSGGGCPSGYAIDSWYYCDSRTHCKVSCAECCGGSPAAQCHCFTQLAISCGGLNCAMLPAA